MLINDLHNEDNQALWCLNNNWSLFGDKTNIKISRDLGTLLAPWNQCIRKTTIAFGYIFFCQILGATPSESSAMYGIVRIDFLVLVRPFGCFFPGVACLQLLSLFALLCLIPCGVNALRRFKGKWSERQERRKRNTRERLN